MKLYDAASKYTNRMRWKLSFLNKDNSSETPLFKSSKSALFCNKLKEFEKDLFDMKCNVKLINVKLNRFMPEFQQNLIKNDLNNLFKRERLIIFGDKSRNMYSTSAK